MVRADEVIDARSAALQADATVFEKGVKTSRRLSI
jgi:hypothetical protein